MNPEDLQNRIEELTDEMDILQSNLDTIAEQLRNSNREMQEFLQREQLDRNISDTSRKIIRETIQDTASQIMESVSAGFTLTPATQYHKLSATAAVTSDTGTAISDGYFPGQILIIEGSDDTNTITIKDVANTNLTADVVLGNEDTLLLIWNGSNWLEISNSNN
jgi:predicted RNase H-like nuclease (RuvC/YqgF family)